MKRPQAQIWDATDGQIDVFVAGVGTGGTLTGTSRYIKGTQGKAILSVAVEPANHRSLHKRWREKKSNLLHIKFKVSVPVLSLVT